MTPPLDTSAFPTGKDLDYESEEEVARLEALQDEARRFVDSRPWTPPIADLWLAFGVAPMIGVFLVRFVRALGGELEGETELWVVVGDLPSMLFETEEARTPAVALRLYCAIAQDWADNILAGRSLSDSYPIPVAPTREYAKMLKSRIAFIRKKLIPIA